MALYVLRSCLLACLPAVGAPRPSTQPGRLWLGSQNSECPDCTINKQHNLTDFAFMCVIKGLMNG